MKKLTTTLLTLSLGLTLASTSFADKMYWTDYGTKKIQRSDLDGSNIEDLVTTGLGFPFGMTLDLTNSKMYWADGSTNKIQRSDLDGSNIEDLVTTGLSFPVGITLDLTNSKIYWSNYGDLNIQRSNLDGTNVEEVVTNLDTPLGIDLDLTNSKIYWVDTGTNRIQRANLDGSSVENLVTSGVDNCRFIKLDIASSKMYWTDTSADKIQRANLDGSNVEDLVTTGLSSPVGLALDIPNSKMYWTDTSADKIQRANLDGSNVEDLVTTGLSSPSAIALNLTDAPLSVELNSFSARQFENSIQLNWSTASETENEGFNIYRKTSGSEFVQIASYKSHRELKGQGNTTFETGYTFTDNSKLQNSEFYTYVISDVETNGVETKHQENSQSIKFVFDEEISQTKLDYILAQNFPNPFNPSTTINFQVAKTQDVRLAVYNLNGKLVKELVNEPKAKGSHNAVWDGTDETGKSVSSGTYFYKISAGTFTQTNKMILLK
ncbi:MAG: T9SS C-terminal target domain-containing protein [Calditrichaeota bacterium]|nr:MAG: T9SS C-terminal target domain-containing protein [Calditrichota bacterium]